MIAAGPDRVLRVPNTNAILPGTYRTSDGSPVPFSEALRIWVPLAHAELVSTAHRYHAVTTYKALSEHVQERSGIRTRQLLTNWIGKLLEQVAVVAKDNMEPPLTALCVRQDGTIGEGYAKAPKFVDDIPGDDIEQYAAVHRLLCYRTYAEDLPADGGTPALTQAVADRRARAAGQEPQSRPTCPRCFMVLPFTGTCDDCG